VLNITAILFDIRGVLGFHANMAPIIVLQLAAPL
jgi:hypothetical protein